MVVSDYARSGHKLAAFERKNRRVAAKTTSLFKPLRMMPTPSKPLKRTQSNHLERSSRYSAMDSDSSSAPSTSASFTPGTEQSSYECNASHTAAPSIITRKDDVPMSQLTMSDFSTYSSHSTQQPPPTPQQQRQSLSQSSSSSMANHSQLHQQSLNSSSGSSFNRLLPKGVSVGRFASSMTTPAVGGRKKRSWTNGVLDKLHPQQRESDKAPAVLQVQMPSQRHQQDDWRVFPHNPSVQFEQEQDSVAASDPVVNSTTNEAELQSNSLITDHFKPVQEPSKEELAANEKHRAMEKLLSDMETKMQDFQEESKQTLQRMTEAEERTKATLTKANQAEERTKKTLTKMKKAEDKALARVNQASKDGVSAIQAAGTAGLDALAKVVSNVEKECEQYVSSFKKMVKNGLQKLLSSSDHSKTAASESHAGLLKSNAEADGSVAPSQCTDVSLFSPPIAKKNKAHPQEPLDHSSGNTKKEMKKAKAKKRPSLSLEAIPSRQSKRLKQKSAAAAALSPKPPSASSMLHSSSFCVTPSTKSGPRVAPLLATVSSESSFQSSSSAKKNRSKTAAARKTADDDDILEVYTAADQKKKRPKYVSPLPPTQKAVHTVRLRRKGRKNAHGSGSSKKRRGTSNDFDFDFLSQD